MLKHRFQQAKAGLHSVRRHAQRVGDELRGRLRTPVNAATATESSISAPTPSSTATEGAAANGAAANGAAANDGESKPRSAAPLEPLGDGFDALETPPGEPPVVARMMVEIRSDGTRTIARGAIQDQLSGEQVSLVAQGNSPLELAGQLLKSLVTTPLAAGDLAKAMLKARRPPKS